MNRLEIEFQVDGHPPAKSEALSMLGAGHPHAPRVLRLLQAARDAIAATDFPGFGNSPIGLELLVLCPTNGDRTDATNYLGGVGDVLEDKSRRGQLDHLGQLGEFALYANDRQIEEVRYRWYDSDESTYRLRIWSLAEEPKVDSRTRVVGFSRSDLVAAGFDGWVTFGQLRNGKIGAVPQTAGVYLVWRESRSSPVFLAANPAGHFKGRDPTVDDAALRANWVDRAQIVYFGKAGVLRRRLKEFMNFGAGHPVGHWGGRLIWQFADSDELLAAWKETGDRLPEQVESELLADFRAKYGKSPFANDPHRMGA